MLKRRVGLEGLVPAGAVSRITNASASCTTFSASSLFTALKALEMAPAMASQRSKRCACSISNSSSAGRSPEGPSALRRSASALSLCMSFMSSIARNSGVSISSLGPRRVNQLRADGFNPKTLSTSIASNCKSFFAANALGLDVAVAAAPRILKFSSIRARVLGDLSLQSSVLILCAFSARKS